MVDILIHIIILTTIVLSFKLRLRHSLTSSHRQSPGTRPKVRGLTPNPGLGLSTLPDQKEVRPLVVHLSFRRHPGQEVSHSLDDWSLDPQLRRNRPSVCHKRVDIGLVSLGVGIQVSPHPQTHGRTRSPGYPPVFRQSTVPLLERIPYEPGLRSGKRTRTSTQGPTQSGSHLILRRFQVEASPLRGVKVKLGESFLHSWSPTWNVRNRHPIGPPTRYTVNVSTCKVTKPLSYSFPTLSLF